MADVSLDDYILQKTFDIGANRGFNAPVQGKIVINNPGVRGRLRGGRVKINGPGRGQTFGQGRGQVRGRGQLFGTGRGHQQGRGQPQGREQQFNQGMGQQFVPGRGVQHGRGQSFGPGRGQSFGPGRGRPFQKQSITFGNNNGQQQQAGLTTKKFVGGLMTKKHTQVAQGQPPPSVTVTGVGNFQTFDARQKLAHKQDARAKLLEKTKFSDARARIQTSRIKKETHEGRIKLTNNSSVNPVSLGGMMSRGGNGVHGIPAHMYGGTSIDHMYTGAGDAGVQLSTEGRLTITKPSNTTSTSNMFKTVPTRNVPSGYEDLFEDEPMSLGSECNATMDFERGPVIKVKNEHFTKPKPTPITFNSEPKPVNQYISKPVGVNSNLSNHPALRMTTSQAVTQRQREQQPLRLTTSHREQQPLRLTTSQREQQPLRLTTSQPEQQPLRLTTSQPVAPRQPEPPLRLSRNFSARSAVEEEEEMILNAPKPVLPKSRPPPTPPPEPVKVNTFFGGPPLVLSRSRPKTGPGITGVVVPPPLKPARPTSHAPPAGAAPGQERLTLSARSPAFSHRLGEVSTGNSGETPRPASPPGSQVLVTNLHSIVTQDDIIELFGALGPLMKVKLLKPGTAEVVYVKKETAVSAVKKYHNRELDGQPMQVKAVTSEASTASKVAADIKALSKSAREGKGPPVDPGLIHKALFKTSGGAAVPANPVSFTVQI